MRTAAQPVRLAPVKRSKYRAVKVTVDGITFASKAEAKRYGELSLLQKAGELHGLKLQERIPLMVPARYAPEKHPLETIGVYVADFVYCVCPTPAQCVGGVYATVEDVKGFRTPLYKWKRRHVMAQYGIEIKEVY